MPLAYQDLNIEIVDLQPDGRFRVRILGKAPNGREMRMDEGESPFYKPEELRPLIAKMDRRRASQAELTALGEKLASLLLPGRVREIYTASLDCVRMRGEGLRLRLRIEPLPMAALPWEYVLVRQTAEVVPGDFLCLQPDVSITRYENIGAPLEPILSKKEFRVVIVLANPVETTLEDLDVNADKAAILNAVQALNASADASVIETVVVERATRESLLRAITDADIFHFAGHGVFEAANLGEDGTFEKKGRIVLEQTDGKEDRFDSDQLAIELSHAGVRLAVLGACNSGSRDGTGAWSGVAPALVRGNVPAVVAMQFKVADRNAAYFMSFLYAKVLAGSSIDQGVSEGRRRIFSGAATTSADWAVNRDWGVPVLYLRTEDGVLFPAVSDKQQTSPGQGASVVRVRQKVRTVSGEMLASHVENVLAGNIDVNQEIDRIDKGANVVGARFGTLGGYGPQRKKPDGKSGGGDK